MPQILAIETVVPEYRVTQDTAKAFARKLFNAAHIDVDRLLPVFDHTQIETRHFCAPPDWFETPHRFSEKNKIYCQYAIRLCREAIEGMLQKIGIAPDDIGHIFFISTTGLSTPSIDAYLFNLLKFRADIRRTPIWGLGCAGGVAGIIRAYDWLKAYPDELALVVSVELCGLTFIQNDLSKSNFVATSLFADGCGVALLAGDEAGPSVQKSFSIRDATSVTWPDSLNVMGWDISDAGLKVIFSRSIPQIVHQSSRPSIEAFLERNGLTLAEVDFFLSHPGGAKVIEAYTQALALSESQIDAMRQVLRRYGNMSSATVFFVLKEFLDSEAYRPGARILSSALGPGFSAEMILATCN